MHSSCDPLFWTRNLRLARYVAEATRVSWIIATIVSEAVELPARYAFEVRTARVAFAI